MAFWIILAIYLSTAIGLAVGQWIVATPKQRLTRGFRTDVAMTSILWPVILMYVIVGGGNDRR